MKYIKIFENKILDDILDKISEDGEKNLTSWEREYLASYGDIHKRTELENNMGKSETNDDEKGHKSFGEYDPRKDDTDFYKELGDDVGVGSNMDDWIKNMSDDEYKENQVEMFWDRLDDDEINDFFDRFSIRGDFATKTWEQIPKELKNTFIQYLLQMGYIDKR